MYVLELVLGGRLLPTETLTNFQCQDKPMYPRAGDCNKYFGIYLLTSPSQKQNTSFSFWNIIIKSPSMLDLSVNLNRPQTNLLHKLNKINDWTWALQSENDGVYRAYSWPVHRPLVERHARYQQLEEPRKIPRWSLWKTFFLAWKLTYPLKKCWLEDDFPFEMVPNFRWRVNFRRGIIKNVKKLVQCMRF